MRITCLCPTFNRYPGEGHLVDECVESFLRQDHPDCELVICNDTPGQSLVSPDPRVRVFNLPERLPNQSEKIEFMLSVATGQLFCRWDDDDISLPWRLSLSEATLGDRLEWRPENYWYAPKNAPLEHVRSPNNTHIMAIWRREVLDRIGGYPAKRAGGEDELFNRALAKAGVSECGELLPADKMFYLYRWGVSARHLSARPNWSSADPFADHWQELGKRPIEKGEFKIRPRWESDYMKLVRLFL